MNLSRIIWYSGISFLIAGCLAVVALAVWWLLTGYWVLLSLIDSVALLSPNTAAAASAFLSESDVFYFIFAEMPLYGLLVTLGGVLILLGQILKYWRRNAERHGAS